MITCNKCHQPIRFKTMTFRTHEAIVSFNLDGSKHAPDCAKAMKQAKQVYTTNSLFNGSPNHD